MSLTRREAAVIGAYTGVLMGRFPDVQSIGDDAMGRPTYTHEYGDSAFLLKLRVSLRDEFLAICDEVEP